MPYRTLTRPRTPARVPYRPCAAQFPWPCGAAARTSRIRSAYHATPHAPHLAACSPLADVQHAGRTLNPAAERICTIDRRSVQERHPQGLI